MRTSPPTAAQLRELAKVYTSAKVATRSVTEALRAVFEHHLDPQIDEADIENIADAVASHFGIERWEVFVRSSRPEAVQVRRVAMRLMRLLDMEYARIGQRFGQHRATAAYSCEMADKLPDLHRVVRKLAQNLNLSSRLRDRQEAA